MKIYTRTGDDGKTSTLSGKRVSKDSAIMQVNGTIDELNAVIGVALSYNNHEEIEEILEEIQSDLFVIGTEITLSEKSDTNKIKISQYRIKRLEDLIDSITEKLPKLRNFILPGGSLLASHLHLARTVCRRAERTLVSFIDETDLNTFSLQYLNRLSDLLFVLSRYANKLDKIPERKWKF
ncbi:MAG TPA: cob(I)yrinic acid a,c-diamide adenosyltransferase [Bacteroidota bacterium]|nr:cob(I)yrinic acid a,c-diamide adenosyltransferase [Bacteroidota bacterium]